MWRTVLLVKWADIDPPTHIRRVINQRGVRLDSLDVAELSQPRKKHPTAAAHVENMPPTTEWPSPAEGRDDHLFAGSPPPMPIVEIAIPPRVFRVHEVLARLGAAITSNGSPRH